MIERLQRHLPVVAAALAACMALAAQASAQQTAEFIWSGGAILTMNDKAMRAEAVAVANGKILAVGRLSEVMKLQGPAT
jgi:outer membrane protein W